MKSYYFSGKNYLEFLPKENVMDQLLPFDAGHYLKKNENLYEKMKSFKYVTYKLNNL